MTANASLETTMSPDKNSTQNKNSTSRNNTTVNFSHIDTNITVTSDDNTTAAASGSICAMKQRFNKF